MPPEPVPGRRVYLNDEGHLPLAEGDYGQEANGTWSVRPPGQHAGGIPEHDIEEHEDGTITVTPSIALWDVERSPGPEGQAVQTGGSEARPTWHGHLIRGEWIVA